MGSHIREEESPGTAAGKQQQAAGKQQDHLTRGSSIRHVPKHSTNTNLTLLGMSPYGAAADARLVGI